MKNAIRSRLPRLTLACGAAVSLSFAIPSNLAEGEPTAGEAASETAPEPEEPVSYLNWFEISAGIVSVDGDEAQFQRRQFIPQGVSGGVESFHYERNVTENTLMKIDGRALFEANDFLLKLDLNHPDVGYVRAGYREYRVWYDGSGGFSPLTGAWFAPFNDELGVDRGQAWFEAGLTRPEKPVIRFRYSYDFRDGRKDSLIWGDSNPTGGLGLGLSPAFREFDEQRHTITSDISHAFGRTGVGLGLRYELQDNDNALAVVRRPGEPQERYQVQREQIEWDLFNAHAFTETQINERLLFTTGYSFTTLDTDISGSRIFGSDFDAVYDPLFGRRQFLDDGILDLGGGSQLRQYLLNLNLMATPWAGVTIVPSLRVEKQDLEGSSHFTESIAQAPPLLTTLEEDLAAMNERDVIDIAESLEARYTRLTHWVFYARGNWSQGDTELEEREFMADTGALELARDSDLDRFIQKYTVGINWYPLRRLNMAVQYYRKMRNTDYDHSLDTTDNTGNNRYPAFITQNSFDTDDVNFRVTWRPFSFLSLVSRYDFQQSTIKNQADGLAEVESAEVTSHIFSQSISWTPIPRLYLQGSITYALDETESPASKAVPVDNPIADSENDYWNLSLASGYALTAKTDLDAQYFYYRADNFSDNAQFTMPFGAGSEEHGILGGVTHRFRPNLTWSLKYGFFTNHDETFGGHNDYEAHLVYSKLRYWF